MSSLLLMEWSIKPPYDWNREPSMFNSEETKSFSHLEPMEWYNQRDPEFGFGSLNLAGEGRGYDSPVSDLVNSSSSKSMKSASISLIEECKNSKNITDDFEVFLEDCGERKEMVKNGSAGTSSALETSAGSSEQLFLSLKLGKGMYYEDSSTEKAVATLSTTPPTRQNRAKRCKSTYKSTLTTRCQVEGCNIDLSSAKEYHRKHRVCESHSRSPNVIIAGLERRFCQQCSRFHGLSDFDEKKRSCRKRLSDHNARRRKSQPRVTSFNSGSTSSVYANPRQQTTLSLDVVPPAYQRPAANLAWEALCSSKYAQTCQRKPEKAICKNEQLNPAGNEKPFTITIPHRNSSKLFATREIAAHDPNPGFTEYRVSSSMDITQDYNSALSLLSTDAWGLCESKNILPQNHKQPNQTIMSSTGIQTTIQSTSLPSDHWCNEHTSSASGFHIFQQQGDGGIDFQLFKSPVGNGLYPDPAHFCQD